MLQVFLSFKKSRSLLWLLVIFAVLESTAWGCTVNQYKRVSGGKVTCIDCPLCPAGYGLRYQCGTTLPDHGKIKCDPCIKGVNYSIEYNHEQCKPCSAYCSDDQVTTCTTDSKPICQPQCKSKENYYQNSSNDCQKCSWCCNDGNDVLETECTKKGMPLKQSCNKIQRKKKCTPSLSNNTNPNVTNSSVSTKSTSVLYGSSSTQKPIGPTDSNNKKEDSVGKTILYVAIGALVVASVLIMVVIFIMKKTCISWYNNCCRHRPQSQGAPFVNLPESFIDILLFNWFNDNLDVKEEICGMLDTQNSFAKVARYYNMNKHKIAKLIERPGYNPTEDVLHYVECSYNPNLLVSEFLECTDTIHRKDVSKVLKEALANCNYSTASQANTSQAITSQEAASQTTTLEATTSQDTTPQGIVLQVATSQV